MPGDLLHTIIKIFFAHLNVGGNLTNFTIFEKNNLKKKYHRVTNLYNKQKMWTFMGNQKHCN